MGNVAKNIGHGLGVNPWTVGPQQSPEYAGTPGQGPNFMPTYNTAVGDTKGLYQPFIGAGTDALTSLQGMLAKGFQPGDLTQTPGYQFQEQQGERATSQAAGTQGSPFSGNTLQALSQFNQGLAATTYNDAFNRWQTQVQNLAGLAGMGANAAGAEAGNLGSLFGNLTGAQANIYGSQAGEQSAQIARGGSLFGAFSNFVGS